MDQKHDCSRELAEIARLTSEVAILTEVIERQREELEANSAKNSTNKSGSIVEKDKVAAISRQIEELGANSAQSSKEESALIIEKDTFAKDDALVNYMLQSFRDILTAAANEAINPSPDGPRETTSVIANIIARTNILDEEWYLKTNPDVANAKFAARHHYSEFGIYEFRPPNKMLL